MSRRPSIYDELHKRRRSTQSPNAPVKHYDCTGMFLTDVWYASAGGICTSNSALPQPFQQSEPSFDNAFMDERGHYLPIYRAKIGSLPASSTVSSRQWQLLEGVLFNIRLRASFFERAKSLLVIYDPNAVGEKAGVITDEWLSHWPCSLRPSGGVEITSRPFFEWLAHRLSKSQDAHLNFCFVAIEAVDSSSASVYSGESATVLWLQRRKLNNENNSGKIVIKFPVLDSVLPPVDAVNSMLENVPSHKAIVWDGHDSQMLKPLFNNLVKKSPESIENNALWPVKPLSGGLRHYDALLAAVAFYAIGRSVNTALALNISDPGMSKYAVIEKH